MAASVCLVLVIIVFTSKSECWDRCRGKRLNESDSEKESDSKTQTYDEKSSLVDSSEKKDTISSGVYSQAKSSIDEMPEVSPNYGTQKGTPTSSEARRSTVSGSQVASEASGSRKGTEPSSATEKFATPAGSALETGNTSRGDEFATARGSPATESQGSRSVTGSESSAVPSRRSRKSGSLRDSVRRPATISEESEIDENNTMEVSSDEK